MRTGVSRRIESSVSAYARRRDLKDSNLGWPVVGGTPSGFDNPPLRHGDTCLSLDCGINYGPADAHSLSINIHESRATVAASMGSPMTPSRRFSSKARS